MTQFFAENISLGLDSKDLEVANINHGTHSAKHLLRIRYLETFQTDAIESKITQQHRALILLFDLLGLASASS